MYALYDVRIDRKDARNKGSSPFLIFLVRTLGLDRLGCWYASDSGHDGGSPELSDRIEYCDR